MLLPAHAQSVSCWRYLSSRVLCIMQVIGWENIELISDRPFDTMLQEFRRLKLEFPDRCRSHSHAALLLQQVTSILQ